MFDKKLLTLIVVVLSVACNARVNLGETAADAGSDASASETPRDQGGVAGPVAARAGTASAATPPTPITNMPRTPWIGGTAPSALPVPAAPAVAASSGDDDAGADTAMGAAGAGGLDGGAGAPSGTAGSGATGVAVEMVACGSDMDCQTSPIGSTLFTPICDASSKVCVGCPTYEQESEMGARVITCLTLRPLQGLSGDQLVIDCHRPCK